MPRGRPKKSATPAIKDEPEDRIFVAVKFEQKNQFKAMFPEAIWCKGKGWAVKDTFSNRNKLDEWERKSKELEGQELNDAYGKIVEGLATIVKKIEELEILIKQKGN
ncbi:MAG: hypothetical protein N4Q30_00845 [Neisseriaceae bacterium]|nr:hypothetical protein [Neisseriaceae bacterium]